MGALNAMGLPALETLGRDLARTSTARRAVVLAAPLGLLALFAALAHARLWVPAALVAAAFATFTYGSASHDLVHRNLGLPLFWNDVLLSALELLALRSGHAYRLSHLHHHAAFPAADDVEGRPARSSVLGVLAQGPLYLLRLWAWSWGQARGAQRRWILLETAAVAGLVCAAILLAPAHPAFLVYAAVVFATTWLFPMAFVKVQHDASGSGPLFHTRAYRGRIVPALLLQHSYHLEHHLYPSVPAHHWRELSRRLDPLLAQAGVRPIQLP